MHRLPGSEQGQRSIHESDRAMMLLTVVLAPLSFAVLFIVMSWTERALDHRLDRQITPTTLRGHSLRDSRPAVETSALIDRPPGR